MHPSTAPIRPFQPFATRVPPALFGLVCVALGLGARALFAAPQHFFWWKSLGVILWCWVVHACVRFVNPRLTVAAAAAWTLGLSWAVELAQLTDLPRWLSSKHWFLRQVFGEVFSPWDLLGAAVAALLVMPVDAALRRIPWPGGRPDAARSTPSSPAAQTSPANAPPCSRR